MLSYLNYTVVLTFISLSSAIVGMGFSFDFIRAVDLPVYFSIKCLLICGLCDDFDGRIAELSRIIDGGNESGISKEYAKEMLSGNNRRRLS